jgi:hypothetical protein
MGEIIESETQQRERERERERERAQENHSRSIEIMKDHVANAKTHPRLL